MLFIFDIIETTVQGPHYIRALPLSPKLFNVGSSANSLLESSTQCRGLTKFSGHLIHLCTNDKDYKNKNMNSDSSTAQSAQCVREGSFRSPSTLLLRQNPFHTSRPLHFKKKFSKQKLFGEL